MDVGSFFVLLFILVVVTIVILSTTIVQIEHYESGVALRLGKFYAMLNPGWNFVLPLITVVFKIDLRIQVLDVPRQEVITKDNLPAMVDAVVYYRVADAKKAVLNVENYRSAIIYMSQTTLRGVIGDMELAEIFSSRDKINTIHRDKLDIETDPWGIKVDNVEIGEVDISPNVKATMEEQNSERRKAILKPDIMDSKSEESPYSRVEQLEKLIELRNKDEITSEEFEDMKKEILERKPQVSKEPVEIVQEEAHVPRKKDKDSVINGSNVGGGSSKAEELREAKTLLDEGLINEDDYEKMKKDILGK